MTVDYNTLLSHKITTEEPKYNVLFRVRLRSGKCKDAFQRNFFSCLITRFTYLDLRTGPSRRRRKRSAYLPHSIAPTRMDGRWCGWWLGYPTPVRARHSTRSFDLNWRACWDEFLFLLFIIFYTAIARIKLARNRRSLMLLCCCAAAGVLWWWIEKVKELLFFLQHFKLVL